MNKFKKILAPILAALILASTSTMVFAKNYDDVKAEHPARTEISILSDIGVIRGTSDKEFSPNDKVTREQMATLLFRLMLGRDDAGRVNTTKFTDLYEPYYNGAISWANSAGYIIGTSDTTFNPTGGIKKQDAMAMLVRALGQENEKMNSGYPWSYINAGIKLGLDKKLEDVGYEDVLTRAETAQMIYNALTSEYLVARTTVNGNVYFESTSIIEEVFDYSMTEATVVATNDYAIDGETVVKNGYVTLLCDNGGKSFRMTVPFDEMNLDGNANDILGMSFKVIYKTVGNKYEILSAVDETRKEDFDSVKIEKNSVIIGGNKYTLVEEYSDELSTNNNELKLYAYDNDGKLEQITKTEELSSLLGFYRVTLMFDGDSEVAKSGIIRVFEMDKLNNSSDGKYNIAGDKKEDDLKITNKVKAESGDYVLYYFNKETKELEIAEVLDINRGTVKRITNTSVKIGDEVYNLGNETAGITSDSLRAKLTLGANATVVVYNKTVVAVVDGVAATDSSRYLVSVSDAYRVYENGSFRYVMTAFVDGQEKNIYVDDSSAKAGEVFRYTEVGGVYSLISPTVEDGIIISGKREFIQSSGSIDEIAYLISEAKNTTIELTGRNYYTLSNGEADSTASVAGLDGVKFVCDKNSVIIVNDGGKLMMRSGAYSSTISVKDGAKVTAVFDNEIGSVETLKFLYISDGSLGNYDLDAGFVRILDNVGQVYENGVAYTEYLVFNFTTGKTETMLSKNHELAVGSDYRCGNDGTVTSDKADTVVNGFVTGFTSGTVTVDGYTFTLASDAKVIRFTKDNKIEDVKLDDLYMKNIEFVAERGTVKLIIEAGEAKFTAKATDKVITVTPDFDLSNFSDAKLTLVSLLKGNEVVETKEFIAEKSNDNTLVFMAEEGRILENGDYTLVFKLGSKQFEVAVKVDVKTNETTETPEQPETPENPEKTETPENPEKPEQPGESDEQ